MITTTTTTSKTSKSSSYKTEFPVYVYYNPLKGNYMVSVGKLQTPGHLIRMAGTQDKELAEMLVLQHASKMTTQFGGDPANLSLDSLLETSGEQQVAPTASVPAVAAV